MSFLFFHVLDKSEVSDEISAAVSYLAYNHV